MITNRFAVYCLLALCSTSLAADKEIDTEHGIGWTVAEPADAGFDPVALADLAHLIDSSVNMPNVHAVLIEHNGHLVFERYWAGEDGELGYVEHGPETLHDIRSISKSVTSLLLGVALDTSVENELSRSITEFFPDRKGFGKGVETITLQHVLTMTAGLSWNEMIVPYTSNNDYIRLFANADPIGYVLTKEVRNQPGSEWNYNSGLTDVTAGVIESLTGKSLDDFAKEVLFGPLNIIDYEWWRPPAWSSDSFPSASAGLRMRARDVAKIASLILHDGKWRGRQIVPEAWIAASTTRQFDIPSGQYDYGYFWFLGKLNSGQLVIKASGWGDQRIYVLPEVGIAITIFAGNYEDGGGVVGERIVGRIVRALR